MSGEGSRGRLARWLDPPILVTDDSGRDFAFIHEGGSIDIDASDPGDAPAKEAPPPATFAAWVWRWCLYVLILGGVLGLLSLGIYCIWWIGAKYGPALGMSPRLGGLTAVAVFLGWTFFGSRLRRLLPWARPGLRAKAHAAAIARLRRGRCGVCDFTLDETQRDEQGMTHCPECGGRWLVPAWRRDGVEQPRPRPEWKHPQRGRGLRVFDARDGTWPSLAGRPKPEAWQGLGAVRRRHWRTLDRTDTKAASMWIIGTFVLGLGPMIVVPGWFMHTAGVWVGVVVAILLVVLVIHRVGRKRHAANAEFVGGFVARGVCPCCEGELDPEPAKSDGALLCRRCGGAWKAGA